MLLTFFQTHYTSPHQLITIINLLFMTNKYSRNMPQFY